jgi:B9 domain-containing protein 2
LLGIKPELKFKDMVMSGAERFGFEVETTGTVEIEVGVITKDFNIHGVTLFTED